MPQMWCGESAYGEEMRQVRCRGVGLCRTYSCGPTRPRGASSAESASAEAPPAGPARSAARPSERTG